MSRTYRYNTLDVLTDVQFAGIPVAVFAAAEGLDAEMMRKIASSLNLPEAVFVFRGEKDKGIHARVRAFSPQGEKALAGASVLAAAWILGAHLVIPRLRLTTSAGLLEIGMERSGDFLHRALWSMPIPETRAGPDPSKIRAALGLNADGALGIFSYQGERAQCLVETSEAQLRALSLDPKELALTWSGGVLAFSAEDGLKARYFSAGAGLRESLAPLSAAAVLGYHLLTKIKSEDGTELALAIETALGRPATVYASLDRDEAEAPVVRIGGSAVVTGRGEFAVRT